MKKNDNILGLELMQNGEDQVTKIGDERKHILFFRVKSSAEPTCGHPCCPGNPGRLLKSTLLSMCQIANPPPPSTTSKITARSSSPQQIEREIKTAAASEQVLVRMTMTHMHPTPPSTVPFQKKIPSSPSQLVREKQSAAAANKQGMVRPKTRHQVMVRPTTTARKIDLPPVPKHLPPYIGIPISSTFPSRSR